jgi:phytoene dehydrogenase-like protein
MSRVSVTPDPRDAVVVGAGPNGLSAAVELARAGLRTTLYEGRDEIGGGTRSAALTLPGFLHDVCSSVHPMAVASPFFRKLPLATHGLEWVHPDAPMAHPFDDGTAAVLERSTAATADTLSVADGRAYRRLMDPLVDAWDALVHDALAPLHLPRHPLVMARFARRAVRSAMGLAGAWFRGERARALFAGIAGHVLEPLEQVPTAAFGLMLAAAGHAGGWPFARGGSQRIADALAAELRVHGGHIVTGTPVRSLAELPRAALTVLDVTPRQLLAIAGDRLPPGYRRTLERYRYGPGVCKVDWALAGQIPWRAAACARAGTVHLGGSSREIARSARAPWHERHDPRPFVLLAQPTLFDPTRAPAGRHVAWAYCHVPHGSSVDVHAAIEDQVERFAPGFRDLVLARSVRTAVDMERENPNLVGGDINGGSEGLSQLFFRPSLSLAPYATPVDGLFLCSASTPPGGSVHGLCGYYAARAALGGAVHLQRELSLPEAA